MVALMDKDFDKIYEVYTDEYGKYEIQAKKGTYPYLIAVKDYGVEFLEFWCQDIELKENLVIDASIDKLEVYGVKVFKVDGAYPGLMVYFRPMSLEKFLENERDICPDIADIEVKINGEISEIFERNEVKEYGGDLEHMKAYLLHISIPKEGLKAKDNYLSLQIIDRNENLGQAGFFFAFEK
jgi:hypothetical protein